MVFFKFRSYKTRNHLNYSVYPRLESLLHDFQTPLDKNKVKPQELLETLNSVNQAIQFTMEFSGTEVSFLDI